MCVDVLLGISSRPIALWCAYVLLTSGLPCRSASGTGRQQCPREGNPRFSRGVSSLPRTRRCAGLTVSPWHELLLSTAIGAPFISVRPSVSLVALFLLVQLSPTKRRPCPLAVSPSAMSPLSAITQRGRVVATTTHPPV